MPLVANSNVPINKTMWFNVIKHEWFHRSLFVGEVKWQGVAIISVLNKIKTTENDSMECLNVTVRPYRNDLYLQVEGDGSSVNSTCQKEKATLVCKDVCINKASIAAIHLKNNSDGSTLWSGNLSISMDGKFFVLVFKSTHNTSHVSLSINYMLDSSVR